MRCKVVLVGNRCCPGKGFHKRGGVPRAKQHQRLARDTGVKDNFPTSTIRIQLQRVVEHQASTSDAVKRDRIRVAIDTNHNLRKTCTNIADVATIKIHGGGWPTAQVAHHNGQGGIKGLDGQGAVGAANGVINIDLIRCNGDVFAGCVHSRVDGLLARQTDHVGGTAFAACGISHCTHRDFVSRNHRHIGAGATAGVEGLGIGKD